MVQQATEQFWQAEARTEETKQFIRDIKCVNRRKYSAAEKIRIVWVDFRFEGIDKSALGFLKEAADGIGQIAGKVNELL